ncbi:MAG TPA: FAD:protein FMN transferase, partial [Pseudonocardiaceae bacterium]
SRFRPDAELARHRADGVPARVSPLLAELVAAALRAARTTDGAVDPTMGNAIAALGYDRTLSEVPPAGAAVPVVVAPAPGWRRVRLHGRLLTVPRNVTLDLGATARAFAADRAAQLVWNYLRTGVRVSLGGDLATAGPAPDGAPEPGWRVLVQDRPTDPACMVTLPAGAAMATSSTTGRTWRRGGRVLHHVLDPRTCQPAAPIWRSATVVADRCVDANTASTAALVLGRDAPRWLRGLGVPARLVGRRGDVLTLGGWPTDAAADAPDGVPA